MLFGLRTQTEVPPRHLGQHDSINLQSRKEIFSATADTVWLIQKIVSVAKRRFRILVDSNDDRLDMLIAVSFPGCAMAHLRECLYPRRIVRLFVIPLERIRRATASAPLRADTNLWPEDELVLPFVPAAGFPD